MRYLQLIVGVFVLLFVAAACSGATLEPTAVPSPTNTPSANDDHIDNPNDPAHIHLDDGSTLSTEGAAPLEDDIWELLLAGDPIVVGAANESMETAVLTIPTMF